MEYKGEKMNNQTLGPAIPFGSIEAQLYPLLDPIILKAFEYKVDKVIAEYNDTKDNNTYIRRKGYMRYFGTECKSVKDGIIKLAEILKRESKNYIFKGTMGSYSLELPNLKKDNNFLLLSYILLSEEGRDKFDKTLKEKTNE